MNYKVLSLWEPWATLLVHGVKKIETRPSPTNWTVEKGIYLIHAAKKWSKVQSLICDKEPFFSALINLDCIENGKKYFHFGQIIGSVEVTECAKIHKDAFDKIFLECKDQSFNHYVNGFELPFGNYTPNRYAWLCQNPRVLINPIQYKGGQGYYQNFNGDVKQLIFK